MWLRTPLKDIAAERTRTVRAVFASIAQHQSHRGTVYCSVLQGPKPVYYVPSAEFTGIACEASDQGMQAANCKTSGGTDGDRCFELVW